MKIYLLHEEWSDFCILNKENSTVKRETDVNEHGSYEIIDKNTVKVTWSNWNITEYFKKYDNYYFISNFYDKYLINEIEPLQEFKFNHIEWSSTSILLKNNNIIFKKDKLNEFGSYLFMDDILIKIEWDNWGTEYFLKLNNCFNSIYYVHDNLNTDNNIDNVIDNNNDNDNDNDTYKNINNNLNIEDNVHNNIFLNIDKNSLTYETYNTTKEYKNIFKKINGKFYSNKYIKLNLVDEQEYFIKQNYKKNMDSILLFHNLDKFNKNYINLYNFSKLKKYYFYNVDDLNKKYFNLKLPFKIDKNDTNYNNDNIKNNKTLLTIAEWGYPPFGGGENWLLNMNKIFYNNGYNNYFICFSDPFNNKEYTDFELIDLQYVKIILMEKNILNIIKIIKLINPFLVNHQGVNRLFFMKIANILQIPFLTGFCFWNNILLDYHQNVNILNNKNLIKDESFNIINENSYTYASSDFVNDVIYKHFDKKIDVIETISLKEDYYIDEPILNEKIYVSLINCHYNKGGFLLDMLCNKLNIDIPLLIIYTENDNINDIDKIKNMIQERNKRIKKDTKYINLLLTKKHDIKDIYKKTKILLLPSLCDETFCRIGYEAMMNNIPILSCFTGNLKYLLKDYASFLTNDIQKWKESIEEMYFDKKIFIIKNENKNKLLMKNKLINYEKKVETNINTKIKNIDKPLYNFNKDHIGLIIPWADQGLGIQGRSYYLSLKELGYVPYIFSFKPYHATYENEKLQNDPKEWDYPNIYYSPNIRENITYDEIVDFIHVNKIKKMIFIEGTFENIFNIAALLKIIGVEIYLIVNIECVRITEINYHNIFDKILCNNFNSYFLMNNLLENSYDKVKLLNFHLENDYFYKCEKNIKNIKNINNKKLSFVCSGGLNSISRKNIDIIIKVFYDFLNKKDKFEIDIEIELNIYIQGIELPENIVLKKHPSINIYIQQLSYKNILNKLFENDIFIHLGGQEGLGLGFYEALYLGLPVLTLDWTPNNEIIINNVNGWLIPCNIDNIYENTEALIYRGILIEKYFINKINDIIYNIENTIDVINNTINNRVSYINKNKSNFNNNFKKILSPIPSFD